MCFYRHSFVFYVQEGDVGFLGSSLGSPTFNLQALEWRNNRHRKGSIQQ